MNIIRYIETRYVNVPQLVKQNELQGKSIIYINPFNYYFIRDNINDYESTFYRTDGFYVTLFIKWLNKSVYQVERQSFDMTSLAPQIFDYCISNKKSIYFCGGSESDIEVFHKKIKELYPELTIDGYSSGYLSEDKIFQKLFKLESDIVVLGLGNKKQEKLVSMLAPKKASTTYFTCGAFFTQTSGSNDINYYPNMINKFNIRWAYRMYKENHILSRVILYYPKFFVSILLDYFKSK